MVLAGSIAVAGFALLRRTRRQGFALSLLLVLAVIAAGMSYPSDAVELARADSPKPCVTTEKTNYTRHPGTWARFAAKVDGDSARTYDVTLMLQPAGAASIEISLGSVTGGQTVAKVVELPAELADGSIASWSIKAVDSADSSKIGTAKGGTVTIDRKTGVVGLKENGPTFDMVPEVKTSNVVTASSQDTGIVQAQTQTVGGQTGIRFTPRTAGRTVVNFGTQEETTLHTEKGKVPVEVQAE
jgi:hypothetical protein